jgi:hypothetical protein
MDVPTSTRRIRWSAAAAFAGAVSGSLAAALLAASYYLRFACMGPEWSWSTWMISIAILAPVSGAAFGVLACGGVVLGRRKGRPLLGAMIGGALGGIIPSLVGTVGYGSLHAPYAGTGPILLSVLCGLLCFTLLASLPASTNADRTTTRSRSVLASTLAALLVTVPFGLVAATGLTTLFPEDVVRGIVNWIGNSPTDSSPCVLAALGLGIAVFLGAGLGLFTGLTAQLAGILRRVLR